MRSSLLIIAIILLSFFGLAQAVAVPPLPKGCEGQWNTNPILTADPKLIKSVPNGKLYLVDVVDPPIRVVHLWGSHEQMGFAMGSLLHDLIPTFLNSVLDYFANRTAEYLVEYLHMDWKEAVGLSRRLVDVGLELTNDVTKEYTPKHFEDELHGIAAATGVDYKLVRKVNLIPELIKAQCSLVGAWGPAIKDAQAGSTLYQVRALDWETEGPFQDVPVLYVYHPDESAVQGAMPFASFSYPGFVGSITGMSSSQVAISEISWTWADYGGKIASRGYPFHYLLRDILEFDVDKFAALTRIYNAERTCPIFIGLGDDKVNQVSVVEYGHDYIRVFDDRTFPVWSPEHPRIPGVVYVDKHQQPSHDPCLASALQQAYGQLDVPHLINVTSALATGNTHTAIYDFARSEMYVASASSARHPPVVLASFRSFTKFDLKALWTEPHP